MESTIARHHKLIITSLAIVVVFFAVSCATNSPICQWLFGCG